MEEGEPIALLKRGWVLPDLPMSGPTTNEIVTRQLPDT
jgi:hypothetical protein